MASSQDHGAKLYARVSDIANEPLVMHPPIDGYERKPLVSLEEAIAPLVPILHEVKRYAGVAKHICKLEPADGLTRDESASIILYSMDWEPYEKCLYFALNSALRDKNRRDLVPWFSYLKLILTALSRLPSSQQNIYRGVKLDLSQQYTTGNEIIWWGFSSCATSIETVKNEKFLGNKGPRTLFMITSDSGKDISRHSCYESEEEILLLPARKFTVISYFPAAPDLHIIQLKEIASPVSLLQQVNSDSNLSKFAPETTFETNIQQNPIWKQDGDTVAGGNQRGSRLNQLNYPFSIYVDDTQTLYVADCANHRIMKWKCGATEGEVVAGGKGEGNKMNQLNHPMDVILDKEKKNLIICDQGNRRVLRWPCQSGSSGEILIADIDCSRLRMDNEGCLYVSDYKKHEVRKWEKGHKDGILVAGGNKKGNCSNQLNFPTFIFVDEDHALYVSDRDNHRVMKWTQGRNVGDLVAGGHGEGNSLTQLSRPEGVIVDRLGTVYVADFNNHRIICWSKGVNKGTIVVGSNKSGKQVNQLENPTYLSFDIQENLYVADFGNHRVQKFDIAPY